MFKFFLLAIISINLFALEISFLGAREDSQKYSILHLQNDQNFLCQSEKNNFNIATKIICAFSKKPNLKFQKLQNDFFKIESIVKNKSFFLIITPLHNMKLYPMIFDLKYDNSVFDSKVTISKRWTIVGYISKMPFLKKQQKSQTSINFPFYMAKDKMPFVDGLDLKGNPVYIKKPQDVSDYLKVKQYYKQEQYEKCLDLIDDILKEYPNTLFKAEFLFYKIRVYSMLKDYDNVIAISKNYLNNYSSDENVPEVLSLTAKAYSLIGMNTNADYFFDRIFTEHKDSPYINWARIYKADMLLESGSTSKGLKLYKEALLDTNILAVATEAAYKLAQQYISSGDFANASTYIMKIVQGNTPYLFKHQKDTMDMMYTFADNSKYKVASEIAKAILDDSSKDNNDDYERVLRDRAVWLSKTDNKKKALKALNQYFKIYKYGDYSDELEKIKDKLFFDTSDANNTVKLVTYNKLIEDYTKSSIGKRAIYEKAKLLLDEKKYSEVLKMEQSILALDEEKYKDKQEIITKAVIGVMQKSLLENRCKKVLVMSAQYKIALSDKWDDGIYRCSMKGGDYQLAKKVALKNIKATDIALRERWLYRFIMIDFETGNYTDVIDASKDLIALIGDKKKSPYLDIYRYIFDTYKRLEKPTKMIGAIANIEKYFGFTYKDINRFVSMIEVGRKNHDNNMVIKYAVEVMRLQKELNSYVQSPYVEFTLYQAYLNIDEKEKALKVIKSLDDIKLQPKQRARQKYLLGTIYDNLWRKDKANEAYKASVEADSTSSWAKLAQDALGVE